MAALWRIFSDIGLYTVCPYNDILHDARSVQCPKQLDPITVAGQCRTSIVRSFAAAMSLDFGVAAVDATKEVDHLFKDGCKPERIQDHKPTSIKYESHFKALEDSTVLKKENGTGGLVYLNRYFSIPKDEEHDRAILNAKSLSALCKTPPPVNLQPISEVFDLLIYLIALVAISGTAFAYVLDLRHWFHQIRVSRRVSRFFGLHLGNYYFRWTTLPMGWSWSPRICQCFAWVLLLWAPNPDSNDDGLQEARRELRSAKDPPRFVWLRNSSGCKVGFLTVTYDNVFLFSTDILIGEACKTKILHSLHDANVAIKESSIRRATNGVPDNGVPLQCPQSSGDDTIFGICHLGVQFSLLVLAGQWRIQWRHEPSRTLKWLETRKSIRSHMSRRFVAKICGIIMWHMMVIRRPLCFASRLISILREVAVTQRHLWDESISLSDLHQKYLEDELDRAIKNEWTIGVPPIPTTAEYILFSDASNERMGGVFCEASGTVLDIWPRQFPSRFEQAHIFLKELAAIVWFIFAYVESANLRNVRLIVVTDNSAAFFALQNKYSSNAIACRWLQKLERLLTSKSIAVDFVLVVSNDNPADCPSRGESHVDPGRLRRGLLAVQYHKSGKRFASVAAAENHRQGLRHPAAGEAFNEEELDELFLNLVDVAPNEEEPVWPTAKKRPRWN